MTYPDPTPFPTLETERLILRELTLQDNEAIFLLRSNARVNQYIDRDPSRNIADAEAHINRVLKACAGNKSFQWVLSLKESPKLMGTICLWNISDDRTTAELGYEMMPEYYGQGFMNEAVRRVLEFGFEQEHFDHIEAFTHKDNDSSTKLLKRNGFTLQHDRVDEDDPLNIIFYRKRNTNII